ncbi:sulfolipid-1 biosynthesis phthioceranic/hydroxyphthioceranic acid synthase [Streptomyces rishiriensis]|uniref:Acyl transferase domain-containing protein/acyl carrier protein n=1 Tax=Streptomyces rishiriensis TaxID=68264 RepID=A0ABU0P1Q8_STRRH|nr:sulfolipid-1 biosynthesis phthioceranic/hydroxyphthioceranic acid synthase [Streptomyces rishiriensis]MDQ0585331.1 acyl transferase domain-containing protein/acyl carrier protein [Streptomyces rishiriensis]
MSDPRDIAVIGIGCRFPGGIDSPESLWDLIERGGDAITDIPADRWNAEDYYDPEKGVPGRSVSRWGGFLTDVAGFDAKFFKLGEREALSTDPQHRVLLETAWEAVEHAGMRPSALAGTRTGVFVGMAHMDYALACHGPQEQEKIHPYGFTGSAPSMGSGRIAFALGLTGPALSIDTACSSGLTSVNLAVQSIRSGESDMALAGGCMIMLVPDATISSSGLGMLSPTGRCRPFDQGADGFVRSEGCGVLFLKRASDALADGDRVLAVIKGVASNQDGRTETITMPSESAQVAVHRAALADAGAEPETIGLVQAHGTGTPVGDPIEFRALAEVYGRDSGCAVSSVKSNIGHTESAAGTAGLITAILALQRGVVPGTLHLNELNREISSLPTRLFVPGEMQPWPDERRPRRAAVSAFGMTGTNAHAILEEAPAVTRPAPGRAPERLLFPLSATSTEELAPTATRIADWLSAHDEVEPSDLGYTLARCRDHRDVRTAVIAADREELIAGLRGIGDQLAVRPPAPATGDDSRGPVWLFSGQGSQWAGMGASLLATEPEFAALVAEVEPLVQRESGFSVTAAMTSPETVTGIDRVQPTLFAMQVGLAAAWRAAGVRPGAVIGHSLGEVAASVVAGALSLEDGVKVICRRSRLCARLAGAGAMASVELPAARVEEELAGFDDVVVSVIASPESTVIGGATERVRDLIVEWERRGVLAREVAVDVASHSPQVDPILAELADVLADLAPDTGTVPMYSTALVEPRLRPSFDADYWVGNLRRPVRFGDAVMAALDDGHRVFLELSPHPLLTRAVDQCARSASLPANAIASMRRAQETPHGLLHSLIEVHAAGGGVDFAALYPGGELVDAPLPTWTRQHLLVRPGQARLAHTVRIHPLLGVHIRLDEDEERHAWQSDVGTAVLPWLTDHRVRDVAAYPGAAHCESALTAAAEVFGPGAEVRNLTFERMLLLSGNTDLSTTATVESPGQARWEAVATENDERARLASATLHAASSDRAEPEPLDIDLLIEEHTERLSGDDLRGTLNERGIQYGPAFQGAVAAHRDAAEGGQSVLAEVTLPSQLRSGNDGFLVHPALLDACFQSVAALPAVAGDGEGGLLLPLEVQRLQLWSSAGGAGYCHVRLRSSDSNRVIADVRLTDKYGAVLLTVDGLVMGTHASGEENADQLLNERLLTIAWQQQEPPEPTGRPAVEPWLILASPRSVPAPDELAEALREQGAHCEIRPWPLPGTQAALSGTPWHGVVLLCPRQAGPAGEDAIARGRDLVASVVGVAQELAGADGTPPRLYTITRSAQRVVPGDLVDLEHAGIRGLLRVIGAEFPELRVTQIDVGTDQEDGPAAKNLAAELTSDTEDDETAWRAGRWYTARLQHSPLAADERRPAAVGGPDDGVRMEIRQPGDLDTLELTVVPRRAPGADQIEIEIGAASINFHDVLFAHGNYFAFEGVTPALGVDCAGTVVRVGDAVTEFQVGDRVMTSAATEGAWASHATIGAALAAPLPHGLSIEQGAAVPAVYATVWYGLMELSRLRPGERVLIHSATGGTGQAAIAVARHVGAEIYATAGSEARRDWLRAQGIEHVYDSRSLEFADRIREDTSGAGVDVVLNSLTGAAQRAGLDLLSFGGRFVEIGKRDIYRDGKLGLAPFRRNLAFYSVDLELMAVADPGRLGRLLREVSERMAAGELAPPMTASFPLAEAATAIRRMASAQHLGKLVLTTAVEPGTAAVLSPDRVPVYRADGAYVITGGLGGLGLRLARHLSAAGCGRIVLNSRSAPAEAAAREIQAMREAGTEVHVECGDISAPETAGRLAAAARATGLPLRGVLHAAAVVEDATITSVTPELIDRDWASKTYGAWYLHQATAEDDLDWFCCFSSAAALLGSPGQGAYAAANSWLDGFAAWRHAKGLPVTTIAWGAWGEIGRGAVLAEAGDTTMITPEEGVHAFDALLRHTRPYTGYLPLSRAPWLTALAGRSPFAAAFKDDRGDHPQSSELRLEFEALTAGERISWLRRFVAGEAAAIVRSAVDPSRPFNDYGLDSLGNLELRTRIETNLGIRIAPKAVAENNSAQALAQHLADHIGT